MSVFNKINILEQCNQMFMCSICCDPKTNSQCKTFSTSSVSLFLEHQRCYHSSILDYECIYCCCRVPSVNLIQHIQNHFLIDDEATVKCPLCQTSIEQRWRSIIMHMKSQHSGNISSCPLCHVDFQSLSDLHVHLLASELVIYHCPSPQCLIKSHSKAAILSHLSNKHNGSRYFHVHRQYVCAERLTRNTSCNCACPIPQEATNSDVFNGTIAMTNDEVQLIDLPYSTRVLAKLSTGLDERLQADLCLKMEQYRKFKVCLDVVDGQKQFVCSTCQYRSVHSLADVRKHILGCHCSVSTSYTRLCLRASRLDTNNFTLFSDRKLITFANEKLKRTENGSTWDGNCDYSGLQLLDDSEQESASNSGSLARAIKRQAVPSGNDNSAKKSRMKQRMTHSGKMQPDSPVPEVGPPLERNESFDRVIQLSYSWAVLVRLVQGQCPERYLSVLQKKMEVYSQHRILLTRRNGKRYFLCSHCPNCSPHGMNDIRKHILGVHARLPERFKSAAMYCSRMNRDNYGLLSDEELLKKNQDMVRWRTAPDDLAPLACSLLASSPSPDDGQSFEHEPRNNVFLSGDVGSPDAVTVTNGDAHGYDSSNESSPKQDHGKGCSRRSLVLKPHRAGQPAHTSRS